MSRGCQVLSFEGKRGGTLVEVMMAMLVLTILAVSGGAYVSHSMRTLAVHRDRAVAAAMAGSRMEELRATPFSQLTNLVAAVTSGTNMVWIRRNGTSWLAASPSEYDSFNIGPFPEQLTTGLQFMNVVAGSGRYEALIMTVQATYRPPDYVGLRTVYAP